MSLFSHTHYFYVVCMCDKERMDGWMDTSITASQVSDNKI